MSFFGYDIQVTTRLNGQQVILGQANTEEMNKIIELLTKAANILEEIIVRHPENTDANALFDEALNNL